MNTSELIPFMICQHTACLAEGQQRPLLPVLQDFLSVVHRNSLPCGQSELQKGTDPSQLQKLGSQVTAWQTCATAMNITRKTRVLKMTRPWQERKKNKRWKKLLLVTRTDCPAYMISILPNSVFTLLECMFGRLLSISRG